MDRKSETSCSLLRRQHRILWLFLGTGFSLFFCSQLVSEGYISLGLMIALIATYYGAGQLSAWLVFRSLHRSSSSKQSAALLLSSIKIGLLFSAASIPFHLGLMALVQTRASSGLAPLAGEPILIRAAAFPFLACLVAAHTASSAHIEPYSTAR